MVTGETASILHLEDMLGSFLLWPIDEAAFHHILKHLKKRKDSSVDLLLAQFWKDSLQVACDIFFSKAVALVFLYSEDQD